LLDILDRWVPKPAAWAFALRIWLAMMLALYAAFWLQLDSASSAAVCVAILAQPKRGQALSKAGYRFLGTVIGGIVGILLM
ncbi:FUSC family protein, partial [Escherichia coli]